MKSPVKEGRDPFNQNSNRSDREKRTTSKGGPVFPKLFRLDRNFRKVWLNGSRPKFSIQEKTWKWVADSNLLQHAIYTVRYCFTVLALIKLFSVTERTQESLQKHSEKAKPEYQAFQTGLRERKFRLASDKQLRRAGSYPGGYSPTKATIICAAPWGRLLSFLVWKGVNTLPILVWNRVWFSRELRECMKVFIVSIPNE